MEFRSDPVGIENLAESGRHCLFDNCVLISSIPTKNSKATIRGKIQRFTSDIEMSCQMRELIYGGVDFFVTQGVVQEHLAGASYGGASSRRAFYSTHLPKLQTMRNLRSMERELLIAAFDTCDRIIEFSELENEVYGSLQEDLGKLPLSHGLSYIDLDLLISGALVGKMRNPVSLVSNDYGLMKGWSKAIKEGVLNEKEINFYLRKYPQGFQEVDPVLEI